ncbi:porin [Pseudoduganella ginsengisoli]|uniref:Porin n=1 Tax=Pseudoduganella ginsengisoli TaxID=1462440 RepID=A0A6L6PV69_9BURK|nr:porin [Pseudoduganella ginsengisoli]MTW01004.1 porin [Pseudoduganella ginsengisoli]
MARIAAGVVILLGHVAFAAFGQTNVVLYGKINVNMEHVSLSRPAQSQARLSSNSSALGFRANEDLGGGWAAIMQIEGAIGVDTGAGDINGKDSFVGLQQRDLGTIALGRESTIIKKMNVYTDRFEGSGIADDSGVALLQGEGNPLGFNRRSGNQVRYDSPDIGGFLLTLSRAAETEEGPARSVIRAAWLQYRYGPWKAAAAYETHHGLRMGFDDSIVRLAGAYTASWGDISLGWNRLTYGVAGGDLQRNYFTCTGAYKVPGGSIAWRYGKAGDIGGSAPAGAVLSSAAGNLSKGADTGAVYATLGYNYVLSARSYLYLYTTQVRNDARANFNFGTNAYGTASAGATVRGSALGIVHRF